MESKFRERLNKYLPIIAGIFLTLIILYLLQKNSEYVRSEAESSVAIKVAQQRTVQLENDNKKLDLAIFKLYDSINKMKGQNNLNKRKIIALKEEGEKIIAEVKQYKNFNYKQYFQDRYQMQNEVKITEIGIVLQDTLCKNIVIDLVSGDVARKEVEIVHDMLNNEQIQNRTKDFVIELKDKKIENLNNVVLETNQIVLAQQGVTQAQEEQIKKQESELKKNHNRTTWYKVGIAGAFIGGLLIAK